MVAIKAGDTLQTREVSAVICVCLCPFCVCVSMIYMCFVHFLCVSYLCVSMICVCPLFMCVRDLCVRVQYFVASIMYDMCSCFVCVL